jgi:hypothetical protein
MEDAKVEWAEFAREIKQGKRKSFAQHLEERNLLHDVVGCVDLHQHNILQTESYLLTVHLCFEGNESCCTASSQRSGSGFMQA